MLRWNLAGLAILTGVTLARADDVIRLGGSFSADDDTHLVARPYHGGHYHGGHGGHYHGGYRGYHGGYGYRGYHHGGYGYRGYGGYYGNYGRYYGGYWGGYGYRPYYSSYYRPYFSYYAQPYYYSSYAYPFAPYRAFYYASPAYYFIDPCADELPAMPEATNLGSGQFAPPPPSAAPRQDRGPEPMPPVDRGNGRGNGGTYRYDGGPRQTVPMPDAGPASKPAAPPLPRDFKFVTQPANPKYAYAAYGETPRTATPPSTATRLVSSEAPLPAPRLTYAAFGNR